jgi:hypothetical protein
LQIGFWRLEVISLHVDSRLVGAELRHENQKQIRRVAGGFHWPQKILGKLSIFTLA